MSSEVPSNTSTNSSVMLGGSIVGEIETSGDTDWHAVSLMAGETYVIDLKGADGDWGTLADPVLLYIYDASGAYIGGTYDYDSGSGKNSFLEFRPAASGTYYMSAAGSGDNTGTYTLLAQNWADTGGTITSDNATNTIVDQTQVGIVDTPDTFKFTNADDALGYTLIKTFDYAEDTIEFEGYDPSKITTTLDSSGYDHFIFDEDNGEGSVRIENDDVVSTFELRNLANKALKIGGQNYDSDPLIGLSVSNDTSVEVVKVDGITSFKSDIKVASQGETTDPINLSDVLAQLKHIIGLKELKANALQAGDVNNDHTVNLSDVLMNLKHIIGLKEIDSFDLVTDNGFAINSLDSDSNGYLTLVINGDADQSHADWDYA